MNEYTPAPERYTDEWITWARSSGNPSRGDRNAADWLQKLDTVARRQRAVDEAHTIMNVVPGIRYSSAVGDAVRTILRQIENGAEDTELYGAKFAREAREQEADLRRITGNPAAIHVPHLLR